jgi:phage major head subunit gpT-like protein
MIDVNLLASLDRQINTTFLAMKQAKPSFVSDQFTITQSVSKRKVDLPIAGAVANPRVWVGPRVISDISRDYFTVTTLPFENTVGVDIFELAEDTIGLQDIRFRGLVQAGQNFKDLRCATVLEAGESTNGYDAVPFFSASHPAGSSTYSNLTTGSSAPWYLVDTTAMPMMYASFKPFDIVSRTDPKDPEVFNEHRVVIGTFEHAEAVLVNPAAMHKSKATLDEAGLQAAITAMRSRTNEKGVNLGITPNLLVVPAVLEFAAAKLLNAAYNASGATNVMNGRLQYAVWNKLSNV